MGLLRAFNKYRQTRKVERLVRDKLAEPYASPSEIAKQVAELPRSIRRAHKLEVRRAYRSRQGVMPSIQRQILAESVAHRVYEDAENEQRERQHAEQLYGRPV